MVPDASGSIVNTRYAAGTAPMIPDEGSSTAAGIGPAPACSTALTRAEVWLLAALAAPAGAIIGACALDAVGTAFRPLPMFCIAAASAACVGRGLWRLAVPSPRDTRVVMATLAALCAWLVWLARPAWLPMSTGPDLTHHLLLIDFIEQQWRLVHDPSLARQLGEMAQYTPGAHILAALAGAWSGTDGLRAFHTVQCVLVALETGVLLLLTLRLMPARTPRALVLVLPALLLSSPRYMLGAFTEYGFFAQVAAEVFVVTAWWAIAVWDTLVDWRLCAVTGVAGALVFLIWPVYSGPPMLTALLVVVLRKETPWVTRVRHLMAAVVPFGVVSGAYMVGRLGWLRLAGTGGAAPVPSVASFTVPLLVLAVFGFVMLALRRTGRPTVLFVVALALQTAALYVVATRAGAPQPYMALKMVYLLLKPMAVCGTVAVAWAFERGSTRARLSPSLQMLGAGGVAVAALTLAAWPLWRQPQRLQPHAAAVSSSLYDVGRWARLNLPPGCIEYLVGDDETAYWLHLAVLRNPRMSDRTGDNSTYEPNDAVVRWLSPGGLPYAIVDLQALPRDVRDELDTLHTEGTAAVARRRGGAMCATP